MELSMLGIYERDAVEHRGIYSHTFMVVIVFVRVVL